MNNLSNFATCVIINIRCIILFDQQIFLNVLENIHESDDIDIVLPCYNPGKGWEDIVYERVTQLKALMPDKKFHILIVNDGSEVQMETVNQHHLKQLLPEVQILHLPCNSGKGEAVRTGIRATTSPFIVYTDWDFPYELEGIREMIGKLEEGYDIVLVSRTDTYRHHQELTFFRRILSSSARWLSRLILRIHFNDTQGGLKAINNKGKEILLRTQIKRFLFDTEFIYLASKTKNINICEVCVNVRKGVHLSYMGLKVMRRELLNFIRIIYR